MNKKLITLISALMLANCSFGQLGLSITDSTNIGCNGLCDGIAIVTPSLGTGPYVFLWSNGQTDSTVTGLCAGVVDTVIVTDFFSVVDTYYVTLSEPPVLVISVDSITSVSCNGGTDGILYTSATGGTLPYEFSIDGGVSFQPDSTFGGLPAGTDSVIVRDANLCTDTVFGLIISEPAALVITGDSMSDVSCNGGTDGILYTSASGGTLPYEFSIDTGATFFQPDSTFGGLSFGTYSIIVRDANLCTDTIFGQVISEPAALVITGDSTSDVSCNGGADGVVYTSATGGTLPYEFSIDGGVSFQPDSTFGGLSAGIDSVIVRDANLCTDTVFGLIISEPPVLTSGITDSSNISCYGFCDGWATVTPGGGILPYTYLWDDDSLQTNDTASGLCVGSYQVIVTDSNGCADTSNVTLTEPTVLISVIADSTDVSCLGICDGAATVIASGGTPPYAYLWPSNETTPIAGNLCVGNNAVIVTDANTCASISSVSLINVFPGPIASFTAPDVCLGDSMPFTNTSTVSSGFIQLYIWNFGDGGSAPDTNPVYLYNNPGTYSVALSVITDKGCVGTTTVNITVSPFPIAGVTANGATAFCIGDSLELLADSAVSYIWLRDGDTIPGAVDSFYFATVSGDYQVMATDSCGSDISQVVAITVSSLPIADAGDDTTISLGRSVVLNGEGGITYYWSPGIDLSDSTIANPIATPFDSITYILTVTDINGCVDADSVTITIKADYDIIISNLMTPNRDGDNDAWYIDNIESYPECEAFVFNRYGFMLFNKSPYNNDWDGTYNGSKLPDGTYYYVLKCGDKMFKGVIAILGNE